MKTKKDGTEKFASKHPFIFQMMVFIVAILLVVLFSLFAQTVGLVDTEAEYAGIVTGRLMAASLLFLIFIRCFNLKKQFSGFVIMLPTLLFAAWNLFRHFLTKGEMADNYVYAIMLGLAPAVFEEVIFRGIFIHVLKASGKKPLAVLLISALFFGISHMSNTNGSLINMLIQVISSIVVGLVFGAIYIKTEDIVSVIIAHATIDICNRMFPSGNVIRPFVELTGFFVLLAVETWYAFWLISRESHSSDGRHIHNSANGSDPSI